MTSQPGPPMDVHEDMRRFNYIKAVMAEIARKQRLAVTALGIGMVEVCLVWLPNKYRLPAFDNNVIAIVIVLAALAAQVPVLRCTCPACTKRYLGPASWLRHGFTLPPCRHCGFDVDAQASRRRE